MVSLAKWLPAGSHSHSGIAGAFGWITKNRISKNLYLYCVEENYRMKQMQVWMSENWEKGCSSDRPRFPSGHTLWITLWMKQWQDTLLIALCVPWARAEREKSSCTWIRSTFENSLFTSSLWHSLKEIIQKKCGNCLYAPPRSVWLASQHLNVWNEMHQNDWHFEGPVERLSGI